MKLSRGGILPSPPDNHSRVDGGAMSILSVDPPMDIVMEEMYVSLVVTLRRDGGAISTLKVDQVPRVLVEMLHCLPQ